MRGPPAGTDEQFNGDIDDIDGNMRRNDGVCTMAAVSGSRIPTLERQAPGLHEEEEEDHSTPDIDGAALTVLSLSEFW